MIRILNYIYNIFIEAIFPLSKVEEELFSMSPEIAMNVLPQSPPVPIKAISVFAYKDERVSKLVWNIKYKKSLPAIEIGGYALFKTVNKLLNDLPTIHSNIDVPSQPSHCNKTRVVVLPMPITNKRRRERGFNQCELLVDKMKVLDSSDSFEVNKNLLIRVKHSSRQTLKHRKERLTDASGIFAVNEGEMRVLLGNNTTQPNIQILVIDDVITTGSTMLEAVHTLEQAGFENVIAISLAH